METIMCCSSEKLKSHTYFHTANISYFIIYLVTSIYLSNSDDSKYCATIGNSDNFIDFKLYTWINIICWINFVLYIITYILIAWDIIPVLGKNVDESFIWIYLYIMMFYAIIIKCISIIITIINTAIIIYFTKWGDSCYDESKDIIYFGIVIYIVNILVLLIYNSLEYDPCDNRLCSCDLDARYNNISENYSETI